MFNPDGFFLTRIRIRNSDFKGGKKLRKSAVQDMKILSLFSQASKHINLLILSTVEGRVGGTMYAHLYVFPFFQKKIRQTSLTFPDFVLRMLL